MAWSRLEQQRPSAREVHGLRRLWLELRGALELELQEALELREALELPEALEPLMGVSAVVEWMEEEAEEEARAQAPLHFRREPVEVGGAVPIRASRRPSVGARHCMRVAKRA